MFGDPIQLYAMLRLTCDGGKSEGKRTLSEDPRGVLQVEKAEDEERRQRRPPPCPHHGLRLALPAQASRLPPLVSVPS